MSSKPSLAFVSSKNLYRLIALVAAARWVTWLLCKGMGP